MSPESPRVLVLWDIDHTLIETRGLGREIHRRAFRAAIGHEIIHLAEVTGRTELDILTESLRLNGISPTSDHLLRLANALIRGYEDARDELRHTGRALPGAAEALALLSAESGILQSVLTGNLRAIARLKLDTFGLATHLDLDAGAYGDDHHNRAELVHLAQQRTGTPGSHTVLIGDTPQDVRAARETGSHIIGVATGRSTILDLTHAGADHVLPDLTTNQLLPTIRSLVTQPGAIAPDE